MFGTVDTWLLYKLTNGRVYVTDVSNASAMGFFDIFSLSWGFMPLLLKIPINILPEVVNNDYSFGTTASEIFGQPLNIGCLVKIVWFVLFLFKLKLILDGGPDGVYVWFWLLQ